MIIFLLIDSIQKLTNNCMKISRFMHEIFHSKRTLFHTNFIRFIQGKKNIVHFILFYFFKIG